MSNNLKRFASYGLYLSLLAAVVTIGLYIVFREFTLPIQISLSLIVIGLAWFALLDPQRVREFFTGRQVKYGSNALILSLAFIGVLVIINYLGYKNPVRWDLTEDNQNTLAKETVEILSKISEPINAIAFFSPQYSSTSAQEMLEEYRRNSGGKFTYKFVDPISDPVTAQNSKVTRDGEIVLFQGIHQEHLTYLTEEELTSAIIRLQNPGAHVVYFLTGHGEKDIETGTDKGYSQAKEALVNKNYTVNELNLIAEHQIPQDALAIVILGPTKPLDSGEIDLLRQYVSKGGALVVMLEPSSITNLDPAADTLVEYLHTGWSVGVNDDFIVDTGATPPSVAIANEYGAHLITEKLQNLVTIFPSARSLSKIESAPDVTVTELVKTSQRSWGETDFQSLSTDEITFDDGKDIPGPLAVALVAENSKNNGRLALFGDSDFGSNAYFQKFGNGDLVVNAIDWAARQEKLIDLTSKKVTQRVLIPPEKSTIGLILLASVFLIPGLTIFAGIFVWVQRRNRG